MPRATTPAGIQLEYDTFGHSGEPCVLLIMGFTAQMTGWDDGLCELLAAGRGGTGRFVVRFDNRDCGLSSKHDGVDVDLGALMAAVATNDPAKVREAAPYTLSDMAADAMAVLDALGVGQAHIVGASMGGMIAQTVAIEHPQRVLSLTSIMSTTGEPEVGQATPEAMAALLAPSPADRAGYIERALGTWPVFQAPKFYDPERTRARAAANYDRSFCPEGGPRQFAAILASGSRAGALPLVTAPTLVIHGRHDPLVTLSGGLRTAELVPGADLLVLGDMAHDQPPALWPRLAEAILGHTA